MKKKSELIFGFRPVIEAIKAGKEIEKVLVQNGSQSELLTELKKTIYQRQIPIQYVPKEKLNRLSTKVHQGVIAFVSAIDYQNIEHIIPQLYEDGKTPLVLILDRVTDVRNFGAICRAAECAGVHAVVIPDRGTAQINADAIKSSAGAINQIMICRTNKLGEVVNFLKGSGIRIVSCTEKADNYYYQEKFDLPTAIIMGGEFEGISSSLIDLSDRQVKIPLLGNIDSLNVAVASGIILYEVVRQRI